MTKLDLAVIIILDMKTKNRNGLNGMGKCNGLFGNGKPRELTRKEIDRIVAKARKTREELWEEKIAKIKDSIRHK